MMANRWEGPDGVISSEIPRGSLIRPDTSESYGIEEGTTRCREERTHATSVAEVETTHGTGAEVRRERRGRPRRVELETLVEATRHYLSELRGYNPETVKDMQRRLRNVCKDLWQLRKGPAGSPRVSTTDPKQLSAEDIGILVEHWRKEGLSPSYQAKLIDALDGFLLWAGNPVLTTMRKMKHIRLPKAIYKDIVVLTQADRERLRAAANSMDGWEGSIARLLIALLPCSGLRPTEFRTQRLDGVDTRRWQLFVTNPKGKGVYSTSGVAAPITPPARQAVLDFLAERETYLDGERHEALLPWRAPDGSLGTLGQHGLTRIKRRLEASSGVKFKTKDFRATFGQDYIDRGVDVQAVSKGLCYSATKTTETYYARIRSENAFRAFEDADERLVRVVKPSS